MRNGTLLERENQLKQKIAFIPVGDMSPLELWNVWDYKWWMIGGLALVFGFFFWRRRSA